MDDGSTDGTRVQVLAARIRYSERGIRVIALDRNRGPTAGMDAGFRAARREVVATLDTDLQNDPADRPHLLAHLDKADVVIGVRVNRRDGFVKRASSRIAKAFRSRATGEDIIDAGCSLKGYRKQYPTRPRLRPSRRGRAPRTTRGDRRPGRNLTHDSRSQAFKDF